jgi:nucleoside 2-deoxyribosyltransferase
MRIYLAGPIFTYGDLLRNTEWAKKVRDAIPGVDLYSPVENTDINGVEGKKKFAGSQEIANGDNLRLDKTDILIACIDGDVLPSGTCAEIGKFHEKIARGDHKYIVGICTDNRQMYLTHSAEKDAGGAASLGEQQYSYQNLYVTGLIKQGGILVSNIEDAISFIKEHQWEFDGKQITFDSDWR